MQRDSFDLRPWLAIAIIFVASALVPYAVKSEVQPVTQEFTQTVSATQTNQTLNFGFGASAIYIKNSGTNEVYITLASGTSTTAKLQLLQNDVLTLQSITPTTRMGLICATGETATVFVGAWSR